MVWGQQPSDAQPQGTGDSIQSIQQGVLPPGSRGGHGTNKAEHPEICGFYWTPKEVRKGREELRTQQQQVSPDASSRPRFCCLPGSLPRRFPFLSACVLFLACLKLGIPLQSPPPCLPLLLTPRTHRSQARLRLLDFTFAN